MMRVTSLGRLVTSALSIAVLAGTWDVWWHSAVGRDTFWEPPHLLLYGSVALAIGMSVYGWRVTRQIVWRRLAILLLLVPLSAPFDELWHRAFGVELALSPLIIWSPPHLALILGISLGFILLLPLLSGDDDPTAREFFGGLCFACAASLLAFVASPFEPYGPYHVLGYWGAGVLPAVIAGMLVASKRWMRSLTGATLISIIFLLLQTVTVTSKSLPELDVPPHEHSPRWLVLFATIIAAVFVDVVGHRLPAWVMSTVAAALWGAMVFGFSSSFFEPQFQYGASAMWTAILSSVVAGGIAGMFLSLAPRFPVASNASA